MYLSSDSNAVADGSALVATVAEQTIKNGGAQSMPLACDNTSFGHSEAQRTWPTAQNWTTNGADTLSPSFRGMPVGFLGLSSGHILMNGVGDKDKPASGASGTIFIDDISYGRAISQ